VVGSLKVVSGAVINQSATAIAMLESVRPTLYFKGQEYLSLEDQRFLEERNVANSLGIEVRHTFEKVCSSSKIISTLHPNQEELRNILANTQT